MIYTLVKPDGTTGPSHDFPAAPPTLASSKGRWLPDVIPTYDPALQIAARRNPQPTGATAIQYDITFKSAEVIAAEAKRAQESGERAALRTAPIIKQLRRKTRAEVINLVQAAFPPGPQQDLIKALALIAWLSVLDRDPTDAGA